MENTETQTTLGT